MARKRRHTDRRIRICEVLYCLPFEEYLTKTPLRLNRRVENLEMKERMLCRVSFGRVSIVGTECESMVEGSLLIERRVLMTLDRKENRGDASHRHLVDSLAQDGW